MFRQQLSKSKNLLTKIESNISANGRSDIFNADFQAFTAEMFWVCIRLYIWLSGQTDVNDTDEFVNS